MSCSVYSRIPLQGSLARYLSTDLGQIVGRHTQFLGIGVDKLVLHVPRGKQFEEMLEQNFVLPLSGRQNGLWHAAHHQFEIVEQDAPHDRLHHLFIISLVVLLHLESQ